MLTKTDRKAVLHAMDLVNFSNFPICLFLGTLKWSFAAFYFDDPDFACVHWVWDDEPSLHEQRLTALALFLAADGEV